MQGMVEFGADAMWTRSPTNAANRDQCDIAQRTKKIFYAIAENEKEIHVADEMDDSGMKKK